ncbi:hypothetical protein [Streptomyces rimosus]|uniref:hypothetical protein n=1 Tax=Streptomyces rimosus TaxID=1927 RepID=UPI00131E8061|nr:hypothetical protein [Streptomyces rimosus]
MKNSKRSARLVTCGAIGAAIIGGLGAPAAYAGENEASNLQSMETCSKSPGSSAFKFHLFYNSGHTGAFRNIGYAVYDFGHVYIGAGDPDGGNPLRFCPGGTGAGKSVKNNAASASNTHSKYSATVYFNSGYKGASDRLGAGSFMSRLKNTYNNNASFRWS